MGLNVGCLWYISFLSGLAKLLDLWASMGSNIRPRGLEKQQIGGAFW